EAASRAVDRAARAPLLAEASRLDPAFPLYRARWAWDAPSPPQERAATALRAAEDAGGVAPLWLRGGYLALEAGDRVAARQALGRALALDPLSAAAPFLIFVASGGERVDCAGRALIADPRLAAATWWRGRAALRERALQAVLGWPGIDPGWREAFVEQARRRPPAEAGEEVDLTIEVDRTPALALSLHLFRRSPLPGEVARIRLDRAAVRGLEVGSAASLPSSAAAAFPRGACAPEPEP
ncbi:MAG TPA: hypothetical protein VLA66_12270, partial [Thermoanaerobaculia bacterium]|nr:hypothetical protein [Thermoanaerobaculia bacterium]